MNEIQNRDTAITRWENFLQESGDTIRQSVGFNQALNNELRGQNYDQPTPDVNGGDEYQDEWMELAQMRPANEEIPDDHIQIDQNYDWGAARNSFTQLELFAAKGWVTTKNGDDNVSHDPPNTRAETLKPHQRPWYKLVEKHANATEPKDPLRLIVNGTAGVGKSYTIFAISTLLGCRVMRCAPTAKAAFIIYGTTIHSMLSIPVSSKNGADEFVKLKGMKLSTLKESLQHVEYIIIDEYSMLSADMVAKISFRCQEAKGNNSSFGGMSVIMVGDLGQLLPVGGQCMYNKDKCIKQLDAAGYGEFQIFKDAVELKIVVRQSNENNDPLQAQFMDLLPRCKTGDVTCEDYDTLMKRFRSSMTNEDINQFKNAAHLFSTNDQVNKCNHERLQTVIDPHTNRRAPVTLIKAFNSNSRARRISADHFCGLENSLFLAVGAEVVLTKNLWINAGLVNGAKGTVRAIVYEEGKSIGTIPETIFVEFYEFRGTPDQQMFGPGRHNWIPINPLTMHHPCPGSLIHRTQFPLRLAYAMTIHKSQGSTLDKVVVELGKSERSLGMSFVALSRVKKIQDLMLEPFAMDRIGAKIKASSNLGPRIAEEQRVAQLAAETKTRNPDCFV